MSRNVFESRQVAHVWANGNLAHGKNHNGQFYFDARIIYSYGEHFPCGVRLNEAFILNSDKWGITTSKHQSYTANATHGPRYYVPNLKEIAGELSYIQNNQGHADSFAHRKVNRYLQNNVARIDENAFAFIWALVNGKKPYVNARNRMLRAIELKAKAEAKRVAHVLDQRARAALLTLDSFLSDVKAKAANAHAEQEYKGRSQKERHMPRYVLPHEILAHAASVLRGFHSTIATKAGKAKFAAAIKELKALVKAESGKWEKTVALHQFSENKKAFKAGYERDVWSINEWAATAEYLIEHENVYGETVVKIKVALNEALAIRDLLIKEAAAAEYERKQVERVEWLAGGKQYAHGLKDAEGGPLLRIRGDMLETSRGAQVPLADAIKVFRMVKLVRERGKPWTRNGATLPVGLFQVDAIHANGNFKAGCHSINWIEIERLAKAHGLFDMPAEDTTEHA